MKRKKHTKEIDFFSSVAEVVSPVNINPEKDYTKEIEKFCKERYEFIKELSKKLKNVENEFRRANKNS
jgi:hypothetical protein